MNKIILALLITSSFVIAGEGEGTAGEPLNIAGEGEGSGTNPNNTATNETVYQLVCTSTSEQDSTQQDNNQYCVLVPVSLDN